MTTKNRPLSIFKKSGPVVRFFCIKKGNASLKTDIAPNEKHKNTPIFEKNIFTNKETLYLISLFRRAPTLFNEFPRRAF